MTREADDVRAFLVWVFETTLHADDERPAARRATETERHSVYLGGLPDGQNKWSETV